MVIEQPGIPHIAGQDLHGPVPTDLLDSSHVGTGACGRGRGRRPQGCRR